MIRVERFFLKLTTVTFLYTGNVVLFCTLRLVRQTWCLLLIINLPVQQSQSTEHSRVVSAHEQQDEKKATHCFNGLTLQQATKA